VNLDLSFFQNQSIRRISENFNVQFRAEIFNISQSRELWVPIAPDNTIFLMKREPQRRCGLYKLDHDQREANSIRAQGDLV